MGMRDLRVTSTVASMSSVGHGSSKKSKPYGNDEVAIYATLCAIRYEAR